MCVCDTTLRIIRNWHPIQQIRNQDCCIVPCYHCRDLTMLFVYSAIDVFSLDSITRSSRASYEISDIYTCMDILYYIIDVRRSPAQQRPFFSSEKFMNKNH